MKPLYVKAAPGLKMPKEGAPRTYITDAAPVQVEASHYYRKAIADGDLVEVSAEDFAAHQAAEQSAAGAPAATVATVATKPAPKNAA